MSQGLGAGPEDYYDYPADGGNSQGAGSGGAGGKKWKRSHGDRSSGKNLMKNANHLLNFTYDDEHGSGGSGPGHGSGSGGGGKKRSPPVGSTHHHHHHGQQHQQQQKPVDPAVAKKAFILQNFQFILTEAASFDPSVASRCVGPLINFDELPWWEYVKFVVCRENPEEHRCPICLDNPRCPRVTVCGHIFCYPCVLRHLEYAKSKNQPRTCPVCSAMVLTPALRPVVWVPSLEPKVNTKISWTLLERNKDVCQVFCPAPTAQLAEAVGGLKDEGFARTTSSIGAAASGATSDALTFIQRHVPSFGEESASFSRYCLETEGLAAMVQATDCADLNERLQETGVDVEMLEAASLVNPPQSGELSYSGSNDKERQLCEDCISMVKGTHPDQLRRQASVASPSSSAVAVDGRTGSSSTNNREHSGGTSMKQDGSPLPEMLATPPLPGAYQLGQKLAAVQPGNLTQVYRCSDGQQVYLNFLNTRMLRDAFEGEAGTGGGGGGGAKSTGSTPLSTGATQKKSSSNNTSPQQGPATPPSTTTPQLAPATPSTTGSGGSSSGGDCHASVPKQLPSKFEARIEDIETVLQTQNTRTSYKSIGHVPLYSSFKMCFVDLHGVVPSWVMAKYKKQIDDRRRRLKAVRERDTETADRCLKDLWDDYRRDIEESHGGTGMGVATPEISPNTLAQMPDLSEVAPDLDLGPAAAGEGEERETHEGGEEDANGEDDDGPMFRPPPAGGATAWKGSAGTHSRAHAKTAGGGTAVTPAGISAQWGGKSQVVIGKQEDVLATHIPLSAKDKEAEKLKKTAQKQKRVEHQSAMNALFVDEETVWTEDGEAISFPSSEQPQGGGGGGGGKKGGKKGKGGKGISISLTGGGRK